MHLDIYSQTHLISNRLIITDVILNGFGCTWTLFLNLLPIVYCIGRDGGWFVALRTTLVHATGDDDDGDALWHSHNL